MQANDLFYFGLKLLPSAFLIYSEWKFGSYPAGNYMFKVGNRNTRTRYEICSKLIKIPERRYWHHFGDFILNFEPCSGVSIINFEQTNWKLLLHNAHHDFL